MKIDCDIVRRENSDGLRSVRCGRRNVLSNGIMSATVPLLLEKNIELGSPPSCKEAVDVEWTLQDRSLQRHWFFDFNFAKATGNFTPVVFASVAIRLGFLREVFGILSLQLLITAVFLWHCM
ncbi:unnamed protein product [Brugia timori]|uniref:Neur_chan_LBD domain-containing protein n=1 Tax=Brugia timori TaxID=42155 RepID=A0A0R3QSZ9_9BILA|nr:unnamed protein product [Brugia timori]